MTGPETTARLEAPSVDDPTLAEIVRRLVGVYRPDLIYLFGLTARGDPSPDSDYDLMVVVPDETPPELRRGALAYEAFRGIPASTDVLVQKAIQKLEERSAFVKKKHRDENSHVNI